MADPTKKEDAEKQVDKPKPEPEKKDDEKAGGKGKDKKRKEFKPVEKVWPVHSDDVAVIR